MALAMSGPPVGVRRRRYPSLAGGPASQCNDRRNGLADPGWIPWAESCTVSGANLHAPERIMTETPVPWHFVVEDAIRFLSHGTHASRRFSNRYETVLWYSKGEDYYFDLDAVRVPQKYPGKRHYKGPRKGEWSGNPLGKNPSDVWDIPNVKAGHVEKTLHPCQFPVALVQRLVRALCPPDGLIVDCFAGSASTGVAALVEGRRFSGCDVNPIYVYIGRERLQECTRGILRYRSVDEPPFVADSRSSVATAPPHFVTQRFPINSKSAKSVNISDPEDN
jgi:hypothetical protein